MDSLASAVISSKVKGITKDFGDVVGLNENDDQESSTAAAYRESEAKARREKEAAKRKKERDALHQEREKERDNIRDKYSLPPKGASRPQQQKKSDEESKCTIS